MNAREGLTRISAVWWGFWALFAGSFGIFLLFTNGARDWDSGLAFLASLIPLYIAYKITCWIIAGFFAPR